MSRAITTCRLGLKVLKPLSLAERDERTGSIDEKMVPQSPLLRRNSVTEARIKTVLSGRTEFNDASRVDIRVQSMTSAVFIASREAMFNPVMFRRTFESPIMVYILESDIATNQLIVICEKCGAPTRDRRLKDQQVKTSRERERERTRELLKTRERERTREI